MARNRALAVALTGGFLLLLRGLAPGPAERAVWLYLVAMPLGYGHVIGAAAFALARNRRPAEPRPSRLLSAAFVGSSVLTLFAAYAGALRSPSLQPFVIVPILLLFGWHIVENDLALGRAYRGDMRLGPVTRAAGPHALALLVVAGVGLVALSTPEGALFSRAYFGRELVSTQARLTLDEVTAAFILYHTVSWWLYFEDRVRRLRRTSAAEAVRLRRRVLAFHLVPFAINAALYLGLPSFHFYLAAPAYYLFWSALHVLHTAASRGLAPRPA